MIMSGQSFSACRKLVRCHVNVVSLAAVFWMSLSRSVGKALRDIQTTAAREASVDPSRMLHLRDNTYHRAPACLIVAIPSKVIYPWAFVFLSWFWNRFVSWPRLSFSAISKYNPESLLVSFTPSTVLVG